jgi:hypothetical protein
MKSFQKPGGPEEKGAPRSGAPLTFSLPPGWWRYLCCFDEDEPLLLPELP